MTKKLLASNQASSRKNKNSENWHQKHTSKLSLGQRVADKVVAGMGSWKFIIFQSIFVFFWIGMNTLGYLRHWDVFPFILLNLLFSIQAAYFAPIIMMAQNRQGERDRFHAEADFLTNLRAKEEIEEIQKALEKVRKNDLGRIERKMEKILQALDQTKQNKA